MLCLFIRIKIFLFLTGTEQILKWRKTLPTVQQDLITTSQCFSTHLERTHNLLPCSGHAALCVMVAEGRSRLLGRYGGAAPSCPAEGPKSCWSQGVGSGAITRGSPVSISPDWCRQMTGMTAMTCSILG